MDLPLIPTIALLILLTLLIYRFLIHPIFLSPLSRAPNAHWTSSIFPAWILYHRLLQRDTPAVHSAHQEHGPVVRLAPNELSLNCVEGGIRTIYAGGYEKGDWYSNVFSNYGVQPMFAMPEHGAHSRRKRMLSNIYAKSVLQGSEAVAGISNVLLEERLVGRLRGIVAKGSSGGEVYDLFSAVTMDFVSAYVFGLGNGSDFLRKPEVARKFLKDYKARQDFTFWPQEMPGFTGFMKRIGLLGLIVPAWVAQANQDIEDWILSMCDEAESSIATTESGSEKIESPANYPTVYAQLRSSLLKEASKSSSDISTSQFVQANRIEMASEMLDHVLAGFDTSGITLTWLAWELSRPCNAAWQDKLRSEITSLKGSKDAKAIDNLPLLHACLMETLRLHAAIPGNQPRVTPPSATLGPLTDLPAGIRVQSQAWSLHRNPTVFPEPESWRPERWIEASAEMSRWFWAFGSGGRMCVGSNLAMLEMKNVMVALWGRFRTSVVEDGGMVHNGGYLAEPVGREGRHLVLRIEEVAS